MIKKILLSFLILLLAFPPLPSKVISKPSIVILSIGINNKAIKEGYEDRFVHEATYLEEGISQHCSSIYDIKKKERYTARKPQNKIALKALDG